jgi:hypothetical protein
MKRRRVIRTGLVLVSLCVSAWQAPALLEKVEGLMNSWKNPSLAGAAEFQLPEGALGVSPEGGEAGMLIISPGGAEIGEDERQRLIAQAQSLAPKFEKTGNASKQKRR